MADNSLHNNQNHNLKYIAHSFKYDNWICLFCTEDALPFNHITNDDEFVNAISENWNIYSKFSVKELEDRIFNPSEINDDNIFSIVFSLAFKYT